MHGWCPWSGGLGGWGGWIGMILGMLVPLALLILGVLIVVWLVSSSRGTAGHPGGGAPGGVSREHSPMDIARERYARGEISREEFEQLRKDLGG